MGLSQIEDCRLVIADWPLLEVRELESGMEIQARDSELLSRLFDSAIANGQLAIYLGLEDLHGSSHVFNRGTLPRADYLSF